jgi:putative DNA primase/helicase
VAAPINGTEVLPPIPDEEWRSIIESAPARPINGQATLPAIRVQAGEIHNLATAGEAAILQAALPLFQRGQLLVRPVAQDVPASRGRSTVAAGFREVSQAGLMDMLSQSATWQRYDGRSKGYKPCDPPPLAASIILSRAGSWRVPVVAGVIITPTLRPDGSLLSEPGYDAATRLFHVPDPRLRLRMPSHPDKFDALAALEVLDPLLSEFPFVSAVDHSVALSALMTPVVRGCMSVAPLHAIKASTAGTGKSYLADLASAIDTGRPCPVISVSARPEETESRLVGLLLGAFPIISIDNVNGELGGDLLCQAVERPIVRIRKLGASDIFEIESRASVYATGNNIRLRGDMTRRSVLCSLDAGMERPESREFQHRPVDEVMADRGRYVAAILTIVRAYLAAGSPGVLKPLLSFEEWSNTVRSSLVWLGRPDPVDSMEAVRDDDPEVEELREFMAVWADRFGRDKYCTLRFAAELAASEPDWQDLREAFHRAGGIKGAVDQRRLGNWLKARQGRIIDGLRIRRGPPDTHSKVGTWGVATLNR